MCSISVSWFRCHRCCISLSIGGRRTLGVMVVDGYIERTVTHNAVISAPAHEEKKRAMAKIGYMRKPDGQKRVPPSTLVPGRHLIGQRPPRPASGRISNGSTPCWLLTPPSVTRLQSHLPDYGRVMFYCLILLRAGVYLVFCGCCGCSASTDAELITISCF